MINVPFRRNKNFVGRADILEKMEHAIRNNHSTNECFPLVLSGLGGMGKTQLMLHYYHMHCNEYKDIFWLNAEGKAILDEFGRLAETLEINVDKEEI